MQSDAVWSAENTFSLPFTPQTPAPDTVESEAHVVASFNKSERERGIEMHGVMPLHVNPTRLNCTSIFFCLKYLRRIDEYVSLLERVPN